MELHIHRKAHGLLTLNAHTNNCRLPDNAIYHFCEQAKKYGVDIFRVFDALNDIDQLEVGMKAVQKAGGVVEGTVCFSGDMVGRSNHLVPRGMSPNIVVAPVPKILYTFRHKK